MNALNSDAYLTETRNLYSCNSINSENISQILRRASILAIDGGSDTLNFQETIEFDIIGDQE
ncbi:MAG: hypothetical protein BRC26_03965 [Nanohaloarchaea archaeon QH_8_44_6]|nr:MAG: hypothetical protein BRC26_03965 [Nanohaloarchaea archaeon QH_8_44_6]